MEVFLRFHNLGPSSERIASSEHFSGCILRFLQFCSCCADVVVDAAILEFVVVIVMMPSSLLGNDVNVAKL